MALVQLREGEENSLPITPRERYPGFEVGKPYNKWDVSDLYHWMHEIQDGINAATDFNGIAALVSEAYKIRRAGIELGHSGVLKSAAEITKEPVNKGESWEGLQYCVRDRCRSLRPGTSSHDFYVATFGTGYMKLEFDLKDGRSIPYLFATEQQRDVWDRKIIAQTIFQMIESGHEVIPGIKEAICYGGMKAIQDKKIEQNS